MRERGLKRKVASGEVWNREVAPRAGAWIEAINGLEIFFRGVSLPVRERGLKQRKTHSPP